MSRQLASNMGQTRACLEVSAFGGYNLIMNVDANNQCALFHFETVHDFEDLVAVLNAIRVHTKELE